MAVGAELSGDADDGPRPARQSRQIAIETPLGQDVVVLAALDGVEGLSRGFVYTIEMFTRASDAEIRSLLGRPVTLWLRNSSEEDRRPLHGHVRHLSLLNTNLSGYRRWRAEVVPWFWFLTRSVDCRVYQNLSIPEIARAVFQEYGVVNYELRLHDQYKKVEFCVRYRETAFDFVSRLLEHVGIFYWFEHHPDRHVLVLADHNSMSAFTRPREAVIWPRQAAMMLPPDLAPIHELEHDFSFRSGHWALKDFDFEAPTKELHSREATTVKVPLMGGFEIFDYPGGYTVAGDGDRLTRSRMEAEEVRHYQISGVGSCADFDPGKRFNLIPDRLTGQDKPIPYFLTEVRHSARDLSYFANSEELPAYSNRFVCIPAETPFRPDRVTQKPMVHGPQTATVTGPSGENIHTDQYGRVKLRFHWDRQGKRDDTSSFWVRVSQHSAGSHWGALSIPHVGQEVVVGFLEGDPDRPMVIGRVHNGTTMPPLTLPRDRHKTVIRDQGDNRLIMHGKAGHERMSMVSPKSINFVAMKQPAKPLSAASVDPVTGKGPSYDNDLDGVAFGQLQNVFRELANPPPAPPPADLKNPRPPSRPDPRNLSSSDEQDPSKFDTTGDFSASTININTLSEGEINSLSFNNMNTWVGGDLNQEVLHSTETISHGNVRNTYHASVRDTIDVAHEEETSIHNEFTGVHTELTGLHVEETLVHIEDTSLVHFESVDLLHIEHESGSHMHLGAAIDIDSHFHKIVIAPGKTTVVMDDLKTYVTQTELTNVKNEITEMVRNIVVGSTMLNLTPEAIAMIGGQVNISAISQITMNAAQVLVNGMTVMVG
jgi:type VI secretion system secreted protein VgrG